MTKIYIDSKLTPRALDREWPKKEKYGWIENQGFDGEPSGFSIEGGEEAYNQALAQANSDSVPIYYENGEPFINHGAKPDSFCELDIELEFVKQNQWVHRGWLDDDEFNPPNAMVIGHRTIARLKSKPLVENIIIDQHPDTVPEFIITEKPVSEKVDTLSKEVVTQIVKDTKKYIGSIDQYFMASKQDRIIGFEKGATHQHPIAFDAGKKEGWNEAIEKAIELTNQCDHLFKADKWFQVFKQELDKLKK